MFLQSQAILIENIIQYTGFHAAHQELSPININPRKIVIKTALTEIKLSCDKILTQSAWGLLRYCPDTVRKWIWGCERLFISSYASLFWLIFWILSSISVPKLKLDLNWNVLVNFNRCIWQILKEYVGSRAQAILTLCSNASMNQCVPVIGEGNCQK